MTDFTENTSREVVALLLAADQPALTTIASSAVGIYQADTTDNPTEDYFLVLRWGNETPGMGQTNFRPLTVWAYGPIGDYDIPEKLAVHAAKLLYQQDPIKKLDGWITQIRDLKRAADARDDGYNKAVVPYNLSVVASGV